ncbi:MAG TPA: type II toxin-antitoxin system RelE/ParE family toxin [Ensifer sp.]|nr:type II toxin-antitoxin system RelE/ParE family toxin [Ensifer sp.]
MRREVFWSRAALNDLKQQIKYIADDNPLAAKRVAEALDITASKLAIRSTGRPGRVSGTFEKSVPYLPFVIAYALDDITSPARLVVLRIIHTARDWRAGNWPK